MMVKTTASSGIGRNESLLSEQMLLMQQLLHVDENEKVESSNSSGMYFFATTTHDFHEAQNGRKNWC